MKRRQGRQGSQLLHGLVNTDPRPLVTSLLTSKLPTFAVAVAESTHFFVPQLMQPPDRTLQQRVTSQLPPSHLSVSLPFDITFSVASLPRCELSKARYRWSSGARIQSCMNKVYFLAFDSCFTPQKKKKTSISYSCTCDLYPFFSCFALFLFPQN